MATFSSNQVRQIMVVNSIATTEAGLNGIGKAKAITDTDKSGMFFKYANNAGVITRTDFIDTNKVRKVSKKARVARTFRTCNVKFTDTKIASMVGEVISISILFRGLYSGSSEDQFYKYIGAYTVKLGDTADIVTTALVSYANKLFVNSEEKLVKVTKTSDAPSKSSTLVITELARTWSLGKKQNKVLDFKVFLTNTGYGVDYATITEPVAGSLGIGNWQECKDLEYFYLGERGDQYRQVGFPLTFDTPYAVIEGKNYTTVDIAFYSEEEGADSAKVEKQLLILFEGTITDEAITAFLGPDLSSKI